MCVFGLEILPAVNVTESQLLTIYEQKRNNNKKRFKGKNKPELLTYYSPAKYPGSPIFDQIRSADHVDI